MGFHVDLKSAQYVFLSPFGYCFRFAIPSDLRCVLGKRELKYSLKTREQSKAKFLSRRLAGFIQDFCSNIRNLQGNSGKKATYSNSQSSYDELIKLYFRSVIDGDFVAGLQAEVLASSLFNPDEDLSTWKESLTQDKKTVHQEKGTDTPQVQESVQNNQNHFNQNDKAPSPHLSTVISYYLDEQIRSGNWTDKTQQEYESACGLLQEIIGDMKISDIDKQTIQTFKQTLMKLPSHMKTSPKYKGKSIKQLLDMDIEKTMSITTVNKLLTRTGSLFSYAVSNGYMESNPAKGLQIKQNKRNDELRSIFTHDDLEKLFISEDYIDRQHPYPFCFWMPILGLYTGCRLEELAQLHTEDIRKVDGIWVIDINNNGDKKIKTKSALRLIPLHPVLTDELNFPAFVESINAKGKIRVFHELPKKRDGYGVRASRWFNERYKLKCGISIKSGEKKDFHSFRHTFADHLKQTQVDPYMISELLGHSVDSITMGRYGKRYGVQTLLKKAIVRINFGFDLSFLKCPVTET
ncbi:MAG TPA: site-specific integrase [Desulfosalsimonadaceae bacterium]|nr:site-specific integrase [Desulfosalsimonadaceae bacterium]